MSADPRLPGGLWRVIALVAALSLGPVTARAELWRTGYFPGWEQITMSASNIDFAALTHIIHFALVPQKNGQLDSSENVLPTSYSTDLVTRAHAAGVKVLISVGGGDTEKLFLGATTKAHLPVFINSLTNFMATRGYDGIDIDWEPFPSREALPYINLVKGLRSALNQFPQPKLLTVAAAAYPPTDDSPIGEYQIYAHLQNQLDQINLMTYDLSGPYGGWVTWFNSPLYDGGYRFASSGELIPSIYGAVTNFTGNGVAAGKLGIGVPFYGYVWTGGTGPTNSSLTQPRQDWDKVPTAAAYSYDQIRSNYNDPAAYHWDTNAGAAYLSITNAKPAKSAFVSYDDVRACQAKVNFARDQNLGGIMIWELGLDHVSGSPDVLLEAIKDALAAPAPPAITAITNNAAPDITLTFAGITFGSFRILQNNCLPDDDSNSENTLTITNVTGLFRVLDASVLTNRLERF